MDKKLIIPEEVVVSKIYYLRDQKVMLDRDLAELYSAETKALKQAVKRNTDIFPEHFMFKLTQEENESLRSQIVTSKEGGWRRSIYSSEELVRHSAKEYKPVLRP